MTGAAALLLLPLLLAGPPAVSALSCTPCDRACPPADCPGRVVRDACDCCDVCARGVGEPCGSYYDSATLTGSECDTGLVCRFSPRLGQPVDTPSPGVCVQNTTVCEHRLYHLILGACVASEPEDCVLPDVSADPTIFTSWQECEKAAQDGGHADIPQQPAAGLAAEASTCPGVSCPEGVTSCPADSVLKTLPSERPECCRPVGTCLCDLESCPRAPTCPEGQEATQVTLGRHQPGHCCTQWECKSAVSQTNLSCTHDGKEYQSGERWQSTLCTSCQCKDGLIFCHSAECPATAHCGKVAHQPGQCCPRCVDGCVSPSGKHYNSSEQWLEDDCTTCSCEAGELRCLKEMCHTSCRNHRTVPGRCCPVCDECDVMCQHGYRTSRDGEPLCECLTAEEVESAPQGCRSMATCRKACPHGFKVDDDGCERCKCRKCRKLKDCNKKCEHGFMTNDRACAICKCRDKPASDEETSLGHADSEGVTCITQGGAVYEEGEQWHDGCRQCYCHGGLEMCSVIACPVPHCDRPEIAEGKCCPTCPGGMEHPARLNVTVCQSIDGQTYVDGQTWQLDACTRCLCHAGRVLCSSPPCPPAPCADPVRPPGGCCATCATPPGRQAARGSCTDETGGKREAGDVWRKSACVSSVCRGGEVESFHEKCPPLDCVRPVLKKNHCCPICLEPPQSDVCVHGNRTVAVGDSWDVDDCTSCVCQRGHTVCTRKTCTTECDSPVTEPGQCCPVCKEEGGSKRNFHMLDGHTSKATHRTVVRAPKSPSQSSHQGVEREPGDQHSSHNYIVLFVVIGVLAMLLCGVFVYWCVRRQRSGYSPKHMTEEKKPLNDPQIMHFVRLEGRGLHQDTLVLEKNGTVVRDV